MIPDVNQVRKRLQKFGLFIHVNFFRVFSVFRGESFVAIRAFIRGIRGYVLVAALLLWVIRGDALVAALLRRELRGDVLVAGVI